MNGYKMEVGSLEAILLQGDVLDGLAALPDESVNCCVTSPPYYGLRDYGTAKWEGGDANCQHSCSSQVQEAITTGVRPGCNASVCRTCGARRIDSQIGLEATPDAYVARLVEVFRAVRRVLRDDGTLWLNIGDSYAGSNCGSNDYREKGSSLSLNSSKYKGQKPGMPEGMKAKDLIGVPWMLAFALRADGWYLRQDIIWHKPNPMPESVRDRCTKAHEYVFLLSKSPRYYFDSDAIREPWAGEAAKAVAQGTKKVGARGIKASARRGLTENQSTQFSKQGHSGYFGQDGKCLLNPLGKNKRSVWTITTRSFKGAHFATFPPDFVKPMILAGCPPEGMVLDPFNGAATSGLVALQNGRSYIGTELNAEYVALSIKRLEDVFRKQFSPI